MSALHAALEALAANQQGLFTTRQALDLGVTYEMLRWARTTGHWVQESPTVWRVTGAPRTWEQSLLAALLAGGEGAVVSHAAAAALHGLHTFPPGPVTVTVPNGRRVSVPGSSRQSRWLPPHHIQRVGLLTVTTIPRTFVDLAGTEHRVRVAQALDEALAGRQTTVDGVGECLLEAPSGRRGRGVLSRLLDERSDGPELSHLDLEELMFAVLAEGGLPKPVRQFPLPWRPADRPGWADGAWPWARRLLEADSRRWHARVRDMENDRRRDNEATAHGWGTLRFTHHMLTRQKEWVWEMCWGAIETATGRRRSA